MGALEHLDSSRRSTHNEPRHAAADGRRTNTMQPDDLLISQRDDFAWLVHLPKIAKPWAIERSKDAAIARAKQYAPRGAALVRPATGHETRIDLGTYRPPPESSN